MQTALVFETEKQLSEYGDKLSDGVKQPINDALHELKETHKNQDVAAIDVAMEKLNTAGRMPPEIYAAQQNAGADAGADADAGAGSGDTWVATPLMM